VGDIERARRAARGAFAAAPDRRVDYRYDIPPVACGRWSEADVDATIHNGVKLAIMSRRTNV